MKRIVLGIEYDGSSFNGYQKQPHGNTVQNALEDAVFAFTGERVATMCAGRTDAGVHALEQVVHLDTDAEREEFSWVRGLNAHLPKSVSVVWACEPPSENGLFHARASAVSRTYRYLIVNSPVRHPLWRNRAGWVFQPLDTGRMREAAEHLLGEHDFTSFRAAECQALTPVKTMHAVDIARNGDFVVLTFKANAFLHHMVRNIVSSLVYVGTGRRDTDWTAELLEEKDRSKAAPTFAPDGLYLSRVAYGAHWKLPQRPEDFPWK